MSTQCSTRSITLNFLVEKFLGENILYLCRGYNHTKSSSVTARLLSILNYCDYKGKERPNHADCCSDESILLKDTK